MPGLQTTTIISGPDYRWLGTTAHRPARTGVLDRAAFATVTRKSGKIGGMATEVILSGTPVTFDAATEKFKPYTGGQLDGFILRDISLFEFGADQFVPAPILDDGRVVTKYVPGGFAKPTTANNNTSIVFV